MEAGDCPLWNINAMRIISVKTLLEPMCLYGTEYPIAWGPAMGISFRNWTVTYLGHPNLGLAEINAPIGSQEVVDHTSIHYCRSVNKRNGLKYWMVPYKGRALSKLRWSNSDLTLNQVVDTSKQLFTPDTLLKHEQAVDHHVRLLEGYSNITYLSWA